MEWVETTGKTIAEAVEAALDRLGVSEADAEVIVLEEPRNAIFGLRRSSARIRARVRPVQARAKRPSRRPPGGASTDGRSRRSGGARQTPSTAVVVPQAAGLEGETTSRPRSRSGRSSRQRARAGGDRSRSTQDSPAGDGRSPSRSDGRRESSHRPSADEQDRSTPTPAVPKEEEMSIEAQAELAESFVRGVVEGFGVDATVESSVEDDVIHVRVVGEGLGLLVGPRGTTVDALQELTRTAVQHRSSEHAVRIHVDVAGYRARRAAALKDFARRVAVEVVASGQPQALEPMNAVDRKVVHDAVTEIPDATTSSEGEDPRRYVVIRPGSPTGGGEDATVEEDESDAEPARS